MADLTKTHAPLSPALRTFPGMAWMTNTGRLLASFSSARRTRRALARLAETSPHLLEDAGFSPEGTGGWRRGTTRVTLTGGKARVHQAE